MNKVLFILTLFLSIGASAFDVPNGDPGACAPWDGDGNSAASGMGGKWYGDSNGQPTDQADAVAVMHNSWIVSNGPLRTWMCTGTVANESAIERFYDAWHNPADQFEPCCVGATCTSDWHEHVLANGTASMHCTFVDLSDGPAVMMEYCPWDGETQTTTCPNI